MPVTPRSLVVVAALGCFIGAYATTPSTVRSHASVQSHDSDAMAAAPDDRPLAIVQPIDDPFRARIPDESAPRPRFEAPRPLDLGRVTPLPPNAGALSSHLVPAGTVPRSFVSAVALGDRPVAMIVVDGTSHVVSIGDRVDHAIVTSITEDGVRYSDGRHLTLAAETP